MSDLVAGASRITVVWTPVLAIGIGTAMVLIDFWWGPATYHLIGSSPALSGAEQLRWVRYFRYDELYDLTLHLAMLALALAGALIFAAVARRATRQAEPKVS